MFVEQRDIENLQKAANKVLFIGSGLSTPPFPTWNDFANIVRKRAQAPETTESDSIQLLGEYKKKLGIDWLKLIDEVFGDHNINVKKIS